MANLKTLLPTVTVPPLTTVVIGSSQTLTNTGAYFIDGAYDVIMPPVANFSKGDVIDLIPKQGAVSSVIGATSTDILTPKGVTDKIVFDDPTQIRLINDSVNWELK